MNITKSFYALTVGVVAVLFASCDRGSADLTKGVPSVCQVHGKMMQKTNVPVVYGLIRLNEWGKAMAPVKSNNFPHAEVEVWEGCIVGEGNPTQAQIYACPECKRSRQLWIDAHPPPQ